MSVRHGILILCVLALSTSSWAQESADSYDTDCGPLHVEGGRYGPFDYRSAPESQRYLVEHVHFNEHYQAYLMGKGKFQKQYDHIIEAPAAGFDYTLWAFPNHYRALAAMEDLGYRWKTEKPEPRVLRVQCYFERAVKFVPDDGLVRALYGYYFARRHKPTDADAELAKAINLEPDNVNVLVYSANAYLELKQFDRAVECAKKAYASGYALPGLRLRLKQAGHPVN